MSKHTQYISPTMHYTVVIALIISLITTFLLGMLLTETLWGGGLGYFSNLRHEAQVNRQKIQFMESIRSQLQTQGASAAQAVNFQKNKRGGGSGTYQGEYIVQFSGVATYPGPDGVFDTPDDTSSSIDGQVIYDSTTDPSSELAGLNQETAFYDIYAPGVIPRMYLTSKNLTLSSNEMNIAVTNVFEGYSGNDGFIAHAADAYGFPGSYSVTLFLNYANSYFTSTDLPTDLNLGINPTLEIRNNNNNSILLNAEITGLRIQPFGN